MRQSYISRTVSAKNLITRFYKDIHTDIPTCAWYDVTNYFPSEVIAQKPVENAASVHLEYLENGFRDDHQIHTFVGYNRSPKNLPDVTSLVASGRLQVRGA